MSLVVNIPPEWSEKRITTLQRQLGAIVASDPNQDIELRVFGQRLPLIKPASPGLGPLGALDATEDLL